MRTNADLRDIYPVTTGVLTDGAGVTYNLDGHCIPSGLPSFKSGTTPGGTFAVGGAVISSANFELINTSGAFDNVTWKNSKVSFVCTCNQTSVNMGEYYIVSHSESGGNISVTAFDALKILDSYEMHELTLTYPTTAGAVASAIATFCGLTVSGLRTPNVAISDEIDDRMSMRQCISYIAQLAGQYVQAKGSVLTFGWYDLSSPWADGNTFGHDWGTADVTITGVRVSDNEDSTVEDRGADGYRIEISGNPFITADNVASIANTIWAACQGITFRAGSAEILASPSFEAGDVVSVNTPDEQGVVLILTNLTYTPDVSMSITSDADAQDGDLDLNKSPYIKKSDAQQTVDDGISNALDDPNSDLSQAIAGAGGGDVMSILVRGPSIWNAPAGMGITDGAMISRDSSTGLAKLDTRSYAGMQMPIPLQEIIVPKPNPDGNYSVSSQYSRFFVPLRVFSTAHYPVYVNIMCHWADAGYTPWALYIDDQRSNPVVGIQTESTTYGLKQYLFPFNPVARDQQNAWQYVNAFYRTQRTVNGKPLWVFDLQGNVSNIDYGN